MAKQRLSPQFHLAPTEDRWKLALYRYPQADGSAPAVILAPGFSCNRHFMDFDERYSLARYLAGRGFDAWGIDFRGRGKSQPPPGCERPHHWSFDDLVQQDVPAILDYVRQTVGHRRIAWVGHSMGGLVLYAYLGLGKQDLKPACAVTLGSPIRFPRAANQLLNSLGSALLHLPLPDLIPQRIAFGALWHAIGRTRALDIGMNSSNIDHRLIAKALRRSLSNGSRAKLKQLGQWSTNGTFASLDGQIDYRANMCRIGVPFLIIAGEYDQLAPPETAALAYDLLGSQDKQFQVMSKKNHFSADYGHVDLILGRNAPDETFPLVEDFVARILGAEVNPRSSRSVQESRPVSS